MENASDPYRQQFKGRAGAVPSPEGAAWQNWLITSVLVFSAVVLGGTLVSYLAPKNNQSASAPPENRPAAGSQATPAATPKSAASQPGGEKAASGQPLAGVPEKPTEKPEQPLPPATPAIAATVNAAVKVDAAVKSSSATNSSSTPDSPPPAEPKTQAKPVPVSSGSQTQSKPSGNADSQSPASPPEKKKPAPAADDPAKRQAYANAVAGVRSALWRRDMPAAKRQFRKAKENQQSPEDQTEIDRLDLVLDNMDQFWKALSDACGSLQVGDELEIGKERVAVVECSRNGLMIHMYGRQQRYTIQKLPLPVIKCLVDRSLLATTGSKVIVGTFLAMDKEGDRNRARFLWEDAVQHGESLGGDLLPELKVPSPAER